MSDKKDTWLKEFEVVTLSGGREVKVRAPRVRDFRTNSGIADAGRREIVILSSLTQLTEDELDGMFYADYTLLKDSVERRIKKPLALSGENTSTLSD